MAARLGLTLLLVLGSLAGGGVASARDDCQRSDLRLRLRLNQQAYTADERVRMRMVVINEGPACTMVWSDGQDATFYVFEDDRKIWDQDYCTGFTQAIVTEEWEHGHREVYRAVWGQWRNGKDCDRRDGKVGPGTYEAQGHFFGDGEPRTGTLSFRITG